MYMYIIQSTIHYLNLVIFNQIDHFMIDHMTFVYSKMAYQIRMCGITYKAKYMYIHVEYVVLHMDLHAQLNRTCGISFIIIIQCT